MNRLTLIVLILSLTIASCSSPVEKQPTHHTESAQPETAGVLIQRDLADSAKLKHIKGPFYISQNGHLYEKTSDQNDPLGSETFTDYFNGQIPQDLDPLTFQELDGWYAKDKHFAYYYRPTSGGMMIVKLEEADVKSFHLLEDSYLFAVDKAHVFEDGHVVENANPKKLRITRGKHREIVSVK